MSPQQWHSVVDVAISGFYNVTQPLMLPMIRTRWGRIVNIASVTALAGNRGQVNYAAAKGALIAATKALSLEVASRGITVNAVAPGIIATDMSTPVFDAAMIANLVPMKRAGTPSRSRAWCVISHRTTPDTSPVKSFPSTADSFEAERQARPRARRKFW